MSDSSSPRLTVHIIAAMVGFLIANLGSLAIVRSPITQSRQIPAQSMSSPSALQNECIGRFQLAVPQILSISGRSQSIYRVDVSTVALPVGGVEALWNERLAKIRSLEAPKGKSETLIRSYELQPGVRAAWYFPNSIDSDLRKLEVVMAQKNHAVVASRAGLASKEPGVESLVKIVLDSYLPGQFHGFCVGYGSIVSKQGTNEQTLITFADRQMPDSTIRFETQTVSEPDTHSYSSLDEEEQVIRAAGGTLSVLANQPRIAAGLNGTEIRILARTPDEGPFVRFSWHFPGVPGDSFRPMVNLVGLASASHQGTLTETWETLLKSLRSNAH